ncbi:hypothetical protein [Microbacterium sp. che218]|uniref:hypothetical protein n=1 Tax=Microbacterium sp. che218 TaxID=3140649 RepID=UPI00336C2505
MPIETRERKRERSCMVMTIVWVVLGSAMIVIAVMSGEFSAWQLVVTGFFTLNALPWWLYLRHERRKREKLAQSGTPLSSPFDRDRYPPV